MRFVIVIFPIQLYANESVAEHVGFARVFIDLLNENDNRPVFSQPLYNISLLESTGTGTSLLRIQVSRAHTHTHTPILYPCATSTSLMVEIQYFCNFLVLLDVIFYLIVHPAFTLFLIL